MKLIATVSAISLLAGTAGAVLAQSQTQPQTQPNQPANQPRQPGQMSPDKEAQKQQHTFRVLAFARVENEESGEVSVRTETMPVRTTADRARALTTAEAARWARSFSDAPGQKLLSWNATIVGPLGAQDAGMTSNPDQPRMPTLDTDRDIAFVVYAPGKQEGARNRVSPTFWIANWSGGEVKIEIPKDVPNRDKVRLTIVALEGQPESWAKQDGRDLGTGLKSGDSVQLPGPAAGELGAPALAVHSEVLAQQESGAWIIGYRD